MRYEYPNIASIPAGFWRWPHFTPEEWACHGDGSLVVETDFMDRIEALRVEFGQPMPLNSGYRSPAYNSSVAHTGDTGPHTTAHACDVGVVSSVTGFRLVQLAIEHGFTGIGVALKSGAALYVHLDDLPATWGPRPGMWSY
jgi:hypothetical protein